MTWFTKYGDGNSPAIIQAEDGEHYSTYPTVANNNYVALPLTDDESLKEENNGKKQTGPADYRYLPGNDPPGVKSGDRRQCQRALSGGDADHAHRHPV
ncbi:conserved hypothetical protein [Klebsiella quasipneumoniae subsp. similipneumoniae]|nr:conserved hypothetical protein [Klebsiella quasipneumoniae subsp. similipneumoniae]